MFCICSPASVKWIFSPIMHNDVAMYMRHKKWAEKYAGIPGVTAPAGEIGVAK